MSNVPIARAVTIDGKKYRVAGLVPPHLNQSRGLEYRCANEEGQIVTVCHAPGKKVHSARTSGRHIVYHWREEA